MSKKIIIGLTGGIGAGKTTVAEIFAILGIPIFNADTEAKKIMNSDPELKNKIIFIFGNESYKNGSLNRRFLADKVFNNSLLLDKLNNIVHPAVQSHFQTWLREQNSRFVIKEAAILFESGSYKDCDYTVLVTAPLDLRVSRVCKRDSVQENQVLQRIKNQLDDAEKVSLSDYTIVNDGKNSLLKQVINIYQNIREKSV